MPFGAFREVLVNGGAGGGIRESAHAEGKRDRLNFCQNALLIAEFVNARAKTTIGDITREFGFDRRSASQYLRRLWVGDLIGKRARGLFVPATSAPAFRRCLSRPARRWRCLPGVRSGWGFTSPAVADAAVDVAGRAAALVATEVTRQSVETVQAILEAHDRGTALNKIAKDVAVHHRAVRRVLDADAALDRNDDGVAAVVMSSAPEVRP